jgi:hypothetical protein
MQRESGTTNRVDRSTTNDFQPDTFYQVYKSHVGAQADLNVSSTTQSHAGVNPPKAVTQSTSRNTSDPSISGISRMQQEIQSSDWIIVILLLSLATIGWIQYYFRKIIGQFLKAGFVYKNAQVLFNNQNSVTNRISNILNILFLFDFSLFVLLFIDYNYPGSFGMSKILSYGLILGVLLGFLLIKALLYYVSGALFDILKIIREYVFNGSIYNKLAGVMILPLILIYAFIPDQYQSFFGFLGIGVFVITYLMQISRGIQIVLRNNYSLIYSFLYFLTIEILPLALFLKWVSGGVN